MQGRRGRLTYANVTATLALALVVGGGTAYAAGSIGTKQLQKGAVTTPKVAKSAVTTKKVRNGTLKRLDFAAAEMPLKDVTLRSASFTFPFDDGSTGSIKQATAVCESDETVVSGGYGLSNNVSSGGQPNVIVTENRPAAGPGGEVPSAGTAPQGWFIEAQRNSDSFATTVTVWVVCGS